MSEKRKRDESPEPESRPIKPIPATKIQAFTVGSQKKSAFQKHKEELEQKKQQENAEAAKVYAEFVASFEESKPYKLGISSFVKSGTLQPKNSVFDDKSSDEVSTAKSSQFKPMSFVKAGESAFGKTATTSATIPSTESAQENAPVKLNSKPQKKRNLDSFLEEIKKEQEVRSRSDIKSSGAAYRNESGSHDDGNPHTTNLYVGNINPTTTEIGLCQEFGKHGPIASVKIMWPRTQEEKDKGNNCGFVSFMKREDAADALEHMDGKEVDGFVIRVGWGKAVPLPDQPFFVLDKKAPNGKSGLPFNAQVSANIGGVHSRPRAEIHVIKPVDIKLMRVIHRMIERVLVHGPLFEALIMDRERDNPTFAFLFDNTSPEHVYYRWKLYSLSQGDTKSRWFDKAFQMFEGGPWWIPPELPLLDEDSADPMFDTDDEMAEQDNVTKGTLGQIAKQRLGIILREVTFQRGTIARAMTFAIDHSDAATEVVDLLCKSILAVESPYSVKLARLYLISDVLHNSSVHVSNAWKYRKEFEAQLPTIFDHFNSIYRSINARLKAEQVRRHVTTVISVWENWMIFPKYYTDQLKEIFLKKDNSTASATSSHNAVSIPEEERRQNAHNINEKHFGSSTEGEQVKSKGVQTDVDMEFKTANVDGQPTEYVDGEPMGGTDEEPMDDVDGEPMDDVDGEPMDDVDGEPMDDIDGEPLSDIDGEPMNDVDGKQPKSKEEANKDEEEVGADVDDMFAS